MIGNSEKFYKMHCFSRKPSRVGLPVTEYSTIVIGGRIAIATLPHQLGVLHDSVRGGIEVALLPETNSEFYDAFSPIWELVDCDGDVLIKE